MSDSAQIPALLLTSKGWENLKEGTTAKPEVTEGHVLVRIHATALNPVDFKMAQYGFNITSWPTVLGCDAAGVVEAVGSGVEGVNVGDEVFAYPGLGAPGRGTFTTHFLLRHDLLWKKPPSLTFAQAASIPVGLLTAWLGVVDNLGLDPVGGGAHDEWVLVWGGSSSVGAYAIQLAKMAGYKVVSTASPANEELVKSFGADAVVNHRSADASAQVRTITAGTLRFAFDTIGQATALQSAEAMAGDGSALLTSCAAFGLDEGKLPANVKLSYVFLGSKHDSEEGLASLKTMYAALQPLLTHGKIKPNRVQERAGGVGAILGALADLRDGRVSGEKLVVAL